MTSFSALDALEAKVKANWSTLRKARQDAAGVRSAIQTALDSKGLLAGDDLDFVLFGSLARCEWTSGSDVDWTLLIDGQADPEHRRVAQEVGSLLGQVEYEGKTLPKPGGTGIFGNLEFSHNLIHHIGGGDDTNRNTTQRILMLLESVPLRAGEGPSAYDRVVRSIIERYLRDDVQLESGEAKMPRIPRFLLNDIVRFWRTMCVDFGWKHWEQAGKKWALRNIKLRMSRKMLFAAGLLMVFSCFENKNFVQQQETGGKPVEILLNHLVELVALAPTEIIARELTRAGKEVEAGSVLATYDEYLQKLNNASLRAHLENLDPAQAYSDSTFLEFRDLSDKLQAGLEQLFFVLESPLQTFTRSYGVF